MPLVGDVCYSYSNKAKLNFFNDFACSFIIYKAIKEDIIEQELAKLILNGRLERDKVSVYKEVLNELLTLSSSYLSLNH